VDNDGAAYEWCLNLTGWVSLSDGCAGQYNGSQHHQTADWPETQAAARAAAAEAEAAWAAAAAAAERAAAATTKGSGGYHKDPGSLAERALTQNFPRLRHANSMHTLRRRTPLPWGGARQKAGANIFKS